jgi:hypothetical protein
MAFQQPLSPELEALAQELVARLRPQAEGRAGSGRPVLAIGPRGPGDCSGRVRSQGGGRCLFTASQGPRGIGRPPTHHLARAVPDGPHPTYKHTRRRRRPRSSAADPRRIGSWATSPSTSTAWDTGSGWRAAARSAAAWSRDRPRPWAYASRPGAPGGTWRTCGRWRVWSASAIARSGTPTGPETESQENLATPAPSGTRIFP